MYVIPQKSYVCDSYITDKKSLYAGPPVGGMHPPILPPRSATVYIDIVKKQKSIIRQLVVGFLQQSLQIVLTFLDVFHFLSRDTNKHVYHFCAPYPQIQIGVCENLLNNYLSKNEETYFIVDRAKVLITYKKHLTD